jgi:transcriptional regulator with XRE-family HTH domain
MADPRYGRSRLLEHLVRKGKKQSQLAEHIKVTDGFISQVIKGTSYMSVIHMRMTAQYLDCSMDDLYTWEE